MSKRKIKSKMENDASGDQGECEGSGDMTIEDIRELKDDVKEITKNVSEIKGTLPSLATEAGVREVMGDHVVEYHKEGQGKLSSSTLPLLTGSVNNKLVAALVAALTALVATIYFLIRQ
jgi:hypothetical protein